MRNRINQKHDEYFSLYQLQNELNHCDYFVISTHENQFLFVPLEEEEVDFFYSPRKITNSFSLVKDIKLKVL